MKKTIILKLAFGFFLMIFFTGCRQSLNSAGNRIFADGVPQKNPIATFQMPGSLSTTILSPTSIALNWSDDSSSESSYEVQFCSGSSCTNFVAVSGSPLAANSHGYTATGLIAETTYRFRVRALQGATGSAWAITGNLTTPAVVTIPPAPTFSSSASTATTVTLDWNDLSTNEAGFEIDYSCDSAFTVCGFNTTVAANTTTYTAAGLTDNTVQYIRVRAYNAAGNSAWVSAAIITVPAAPTMNASTNLNGTSVTLNWTDNSTSESYFEIQKCTGIACTDYATYAGAAANATSAGIGGLAYGATYGFRVRAVGLLGTAGASSWATVSVTTSSFFTAPTTFTATASGSTTMTLNWAGNVAGETGYEVDHCTGSVCSDFGGTILVVGHTLTTTITGLTAATAYTFRLRTYDLSSGATVYSSPMTAVQTTLSLPATPQNVRVKGLTATKISIGWDDLATDETAYEVSHCVDVGCTTSTYIVDSAVLPANSSRYTFTGLSASSSYQLRVRAIRAATPDYSAAAYSETISPSDESQVWVADGTVRAQYRSGRNLYVGGDFTFLAPPVKYAGLLSISGAAWSPSVLANQVQNTLDGSVLTSAADGSGGFYIGGTFTQGIHHILSTGALDPAFNVTADGSVTALTLSGTTLYLGGNFTNLTQGGVTARNHMAALNVSGGVPVILAFDPNVSGIVNSIAVSGTTVFFGGTFASVDGGTGCANLAAFTTTNNHVTTWCPSPDAAVTAIKVSAGAVFVGGSFLNINSVARSYLASLSTTTTSVSFSGVVPSSPNGSVTSLDVSGTTLYLGGNFTTVGASSRTYLAAIDTTTGNVASLNVAINGAVESLVTDGANVILGGSFTSVAGVSRKYIAAISAFTGTPESTFDPRASAPVYSVSMDIPNNAILFGGAFTWIGGVNRNYLASIDITTGIPNTWDPQPNGSVRTITGNSSYIYFGGDFTTVRGVAQSYFAAIDPVTDSSFRSFYNGLNGAVYALATYDGVVYAGGAFTAAGGSTRQRLAAFDANSFTLSSWNPTAGNDPLGNVQALAVDYMSVSGTGATTIFVGGDFTNIAGTARTGLAAVKSDGTLVTTYDPAPDSGVYALEVDHVGRNLYVGGNFTTIASAASKYLASLIINENPTIMVGASDPNFNGTVYSVKISTDGSAVLAGGSFDTAWAGTTRRGAASLDLALAVGLNAWDPDLDVGNIAVTLEPSIDTVTVGGSISSFDGEAFLNLGSTLLSSGALTAW